MNWSPTRDRPGSGDTVRESCRFTVLRFLGDAWQEWSNRYASVDIRGSAIERSQGRQRKLDGIVNWYFDYVMESLPLMLQAALLLLGCALSRYFWEINMAVASVVLGVTSLGVLFYLYIVVAGAVSVSCPYQTPGADILRYILDIICRIADTPIVPNVSHRMLVTLRRIRATRRDILDPHRQTHHLPRIFRCIPHILGVLRSVFSASIKQSLGHVSLVMMWVLLKSHYRTPVTIAVPLLSILLIPVWLVVDACRLTNWMLVVSFRGVYSWLHQGSEHQVAALDLRCILWTLRTSLDGPVRLPILNYLTATTLTNFDHTLVVDCFDVLLGCVKVSDDRTVVTQGLEQLAAASALCCPHTLSHLTVMGSTPRVLEKVRQRYDKAFSSTTIFVASNFPTRCRRSCARQCCPVRIPKEGMWGSASLAPPLRASFTILFPPASGLGCY